MGRFDRMPAGTYPNSQEAEGERASAPSRVALVEAARGLLTRRHRRAQLFGKAMFREPAWEMLVSLYAQQDEQRFTIASLSSHSGAPATTALRWIDYLEKRRLVRRQAHPTDARAVYVELTDEAHSSLDLYFYETLTRAR